MNTDPTRFPCGHKRTPDNTYQSEGQSKRCRKCKNAYTAAHRQAGDTRDMKPLLEQVWR